MKKPKSVLQSDEINRLQTELKQQLAHVERNEENGRFDTVFHENVTRIRAAIKQLEATTDGTQNE